MKWDKLMHHDEQELLSLCEGWHCNDSKGGWLDPELCARARREEVEYIRRHKMCMRVHREVCMRETAEAPIKTGWAAGLTREAQRAREVGREGIQDARKARVVRVVAAAGGAESGAVGDRHG